MSKVVPDYWHYTDVPRPLMPPLQSEEHYYYPGLLSHISQ